MKLDLTNDGDWADTGEYDDNRTHNVVNELTNRDLDGSGGSGPNYTLTYSANGELTSDGHEYEYSWDAWGRLVQVYSIQADAVVSDFEYNGLGWQKSFTEAIAGGGTATFWNTHDHQGRTLQTRRGTDASGGGAAWFKVRYVYHNAGHAGSGSSSYRNAIVLRDADMTNGWTGAADGTLEARHYYCQNYRGDVVALVTAAGKLAEQVRYDAYGYPTCLPTGDTDSDGDWDASDSANITGAYDIRKDVNLDGTISSADVTDANTINGTTVTLGRGVLSNDTKCHSRPGWQGSEHASATPSRLLHTPARHHHLVLGRWISRDPAGYATSADCNEHYMSDNMAWCTIPRATQCVLCVNDATRNTETPLDTTPLPEHVAGPIGTAMCKAWCIDNYKPGKKLSECEKMCKLIKNANCAGLWGLCEHLGRHRLKVQAESCVLFYNTVCKGT